jgi:hypothetical protein
MLHLELLYDSMAKNKFSNDGKCSPLGQVTGVEVVKAGVLKLDETSEHWSAQNKRQFVLDLSGKSPQLICQP